MSSKGQSLKNREIPVKARRWILNWVEKYKQGEEPRGVRFASIAEKNKEKKKERFEKHKEDFAKRVARKLYERNQEKKQKKAWYRLIKKVNAERVKVKQEQLKKLDNKIAPQDQKQDQAN